MPHAAGPLSLAQAVFDSIPEPVVVLDAAFCIVAISRSFRSMYGHGDVEPAGGNIFDLFSGRWNLPSLRQLLAAVAGGEVEEVHDAIEHEPVFGEGATLFSARRIEPVDSSDGVIVLTIADVSAHRARERDQKALLDHAEELLRQQAIILREMEHRVANSLQIIASILMLKARAVSSDETREHLEDAHKRVLSVAEVQKHLHPAGGYDRTEVSTYLEKLCAGLARSMVRDPTRTTVKVIADQKIVASSEAVSLGLIVTELVINAIKHAFPDDRADALILVTYECDQANWKLVVSDNGVGKIAGVPAKNGGLGTTIVAALAKQLESIVENTDEGKGFSVALTRASYSSRMPKAN